LQPETKKEIIQKIRNITKETNQHIPILYNLSYFRTLIKNIFSVDKSDPSENVLLEHKEINLSENQSIYIFKEKKEIEDFLEKNTQSVNNIKDPSEAAYDTSNKISSNSLPTFANNNLVNTNEIRNVYYNLSNVEDGAKEFKSFKETLDKELNVNLTEENASQNINNINNNNFNIAAASAAAANNNNNNNNVINNIINNPINIENNQEVQDLNENAEIANMLNNLEILRNKNFIILGTEPPLNFKNFELSDLIHVNFGEVTFTVCEIGDNFIKCKCLNSGKVKERNSFSVERKDHFLSELILTQESKLYEELIDAVDLKVDYIVISIISEPNKEIE
jgi:hypothetical protein